MKILIADDNIDYSALLKRAFSSYGEVDTVDNGTAAFKAFCRALKNEQPYRLIIMDLSMPMRHGFDTVRGIRKMEQSLNLDSKLRATIFAVSGLIGEKHSTKALEVGCDRFISKGQGINIVVNAAEELGLFELPEAAPKHTADGNAGNEQQAGEDDEENFGEWFLNRCFPPSPR